MDFYFSQLKNIETSRKHRADTGSGEPEQHVGDGLKDVRRGTPVWYEGI
jgi:hypothetical protein